jgi:hypothetical protein
MDRVDIDEKWFYLSEVVTCTTWYLGRYHHTIPVRTRATSLRLCVSQRWLAHDRILLLESGGMEKLAPGSLLGRNQPSGHQKIALPGLWRQSLFL